MWGGRTIDHVLSAQAGNLRRSVVLTALNSNPSLNRQIEATVSLQQLFFNTRMTSVPSAKDCTVLASERDRFQTQLGLSRLFARWLECYFFFKNWFSNGDTIFLPPKLGTPKQDS